MRDRTCCVSCLTESMNSEWKDLGARNRKGRNRSPGFFARQANRRARMTVVKETLRPDSNDPLPSPAKCEKSRAAGGIIGGTADAPDLGFFSA